MLSARYSVQQDEATVRAINQTERDRERVRERGNGIAKFNNDHIDTIVSLG